MAAIVKELRIAAPPERVFSALIQQDEIARWWTSDLSIKPEVGSLAEFRFKGGKIGILQFNIAELDQDKKVCWASRRGPTDWAETVVTWQLTPVRDGTTLVFTHDGFAQINAMYEQTRENWEYFLKSLKSYLETGQGTPGIPPNLG